MALSQKNHLFISTPLIFSEPLSKVAKTNIYLKIEALQPSGSFKNRGIGLFCSEMKKRGARKFVCSSGGNAGLAAAYAAKQLNLPITVIVPNGTSPLMVNKIKNEQAKILLHGQDWKEADIYARQLCETNKSIYVPPFDDPLIWAGNSTLVTEVLNSGLRPDAVVVAVGGGGLYCGIVEGLKKANLTKTCIFSVETEGAHSFYAAIQAKRVVEIDKISSVAKSLGARSVAQKALEYGLSHPTEAKLVSDSDSIKACIEFANHHRILVEPACGAALSLCSNSNLPLQKFKNVLVVVCGGASISPEMLINWSNEFNL